jgi:hypothetical protein
MREKAEGCRGRRRASLGLGHSVECHKSLKFKEQGLFSTENWLLNADYFSPWFIEGFDTKYLQEAKALLEELSH